MDTAVSRGSGSAEELSAVVQPQNGTDDTVALGLSCLNTSFHANDAGERGGALYSTTVSLVFVFARRLMLAMRVYSSPLIREHSSSVREEYDHLLP